VTGAKKIPGVVAVRMEPLDNVLYVRFDTRVTDEARVTAAVRTVIDNVEN